MVSEVVAEVEEGVEDLSTLLGEEIRSKADLAVRVRALRRAPASEAAAALQAAVLDFLVANLRTGPDLARVILRWVEPSGELRLPLHLLLTAGKTVRFAGAVEELVFHSDSAILAKTDRNRRKSEKKRRLREKRSSESSTGSLASPCGSLVEEGGDDSGVASSLEETVLEEQGEGEEGESAGLMFNLDF